ncbi:MAG TPA: hypothetical protein VF395_17740 [Polyangiaceae bacterium]
MAAVPDEVARLFWDVDPASVDLDRHRDYVMERIMDRGTWEAMRWLRRTYPREALADFLLRKGKRLIAPRERAYWALVSGCKLPAEPGGGRPAWARP